MNKPVKNKARKQKGRQNENLLMFLLPFILLFSALLLTSFVSVIIDLEKKLNSPVITVIFSLCTFLSAFLIASKKREKGLVTGVIYNSPSIIIILLLSLILNGFSADLNILLSFVTMLISSALGGIIGVNRKQKAKRGMR